MTTQTNTQSNYVWMLKNKLTGEIYEPYSYKTRKSARKAVSSVTGRFRNYTPVKVFTKTKTTTKVANNTRITNTKTTFTSGSRGIGGYNISKSWSLTSNRRFKV